MKLQIIRAAVRGMGVVDLPKVIVVVQFDSARWVKPSLRSMVSMRDRSWGVGARSASTIPDNNMPAAKTRPDRMCLIVDMGQFRVYACMANADGLGQLPRSMAPS
jgi:hypothetical protein